MSWLKNFSLFIIWFAIIFYLSFTPLTEWPKLGVFEKLYFDKVVHIAMYGIFCFLLLWGLSRQNQGKKISSSSIIASILFCAGVGIAIEFLQPILTMFRQFEVADMIANAIGSITGFYFFSLILKRSWLGLKSS